MGNRFDTINNNLRLTGNTTATSITGDLSVSGGIRPSTPFVFRNRIINGSMEIDQRNAGSPVTVATSAWTYTLDRWRCYTQSGAGSGSISRVATTDLNETGYYLRFNQTIATTVGSPYLSQPIEDIRLFNGSTVTLSFKARTASGTAGIAVGLSKQYGTGGSTAEYTTNSSYTLTTSWQTFTYTATLSSNAGKTIGTGSHLDVYFALPSLATFDIHITDVQLEFGSVATPFERRPLGTELALCQRYYEENRVEINSGSSSNRPYYQMTFYYQVPKRAAPTFTSTGTFATVSGTPGATIDSITASRFRIYPSDTNVWSSCVIDWKATAEL